MLLYRKIRSLKPNCRLCPCPLLWNSLPSGSPQHVFYALFYSYLFFKSSGWSCDTQGNFSLLPNFMNKQPRHAIIMQSTAEAFSIIIESLGVSEHKWNPILVIEILFTVISLFFYLKKNSTNLSTTANI